MSPDFNIREALPQDVVSMVAIDALVAPVPWSADQFSAACGERAPSAPWALVVEIADEVCGFLVLSPVLDEATVYNIAVHPGQQRRGVAIALLEAAIERLESAGAGRCLLEVRTSNAPARRLYRRLGFEVDGVRKNYYPLEGGREDALLMSRCL